MNKLSCSFFSFNSGLSSSTKLLSIKERLKKFISTKYFLSQVIKYLALFRTTPIFFNSLNVILKYFRELIIFFAEVIPIPGIFNKSVYEQVLISLGNSFKLRKAQSVFGSTNKLKLGF